MKGRWEMGGWGGGGEGAYGGTRFEQVLHIDKYTRHDLEHLEVCTLRI